jgi:alpha-beta hydrolase superfamily lysophospholipase
MVHGSALRTSNALDHPLARVIDSLAHLLPAQGPISIFIHHNTLHALEHLPFEDAVVTTADGLHLNGWFVPGGGRATVMVVHGYKDQRGSMLGVTDVLHRHGYSVLVASLRGHDINDGELISFGLYEVRDLAAWDAYLQRRADVDHARTGIFGVSMGGSISLRYASEHPNVRTVIADSAFSSVSDTAATSIKFFTGLPPFPFAPAIVFWAEREIGGGSVSVLDATKWIRAIAPRPVFLMQGGADTVVSVESGRKLFDAAGDPKEFWFEPTVGHAKFLKMMPEQFETRVTGFLDRYLK